MSVKVEMSPKISDLGHPLMSTSETSCEREDIDGMSQSWVLVNGAQALGDDGTVATRRAGMRR